MRREVGCLCPALVFRIQGELAALTFLDLDEVRKLSYCRDGHVQNLRLFEHFDRLNGAGVDDHRLLLIDQKVTLEQRCSEFLT